MLTRPAFVSTALEADEGTRMEVDTDSGADGGLFGADVGLGGIDTHHGLPPYGRPIAVSGTSSASVTTPPLSRAAPRQRYATAPGWRKRSAGLHHTLAPRSSTTALAAL